MAAAIAPRETPKYNAILRSLPVAASVTIYAGTMVAVDTSGYARPARTSTTDRVVGMARATVTNGAVAGAVNVEVDSESIVRMGNSTSGDLIAGTEVGATIYAVDDQTVAKTNGTNTRVAAGTCFAVDSAGVWVKFAS